jgi:Cyclopropane fatty acid synthase and related methyltransferases
MSISKLTRSAYDAGTALLLELFESPYLNLGCWEDSGSSFPRAQQRLVEIFGEFSQLGSGQEVIDAGCGTGEQDLELLQRYDCKRILGLNISPVQVEIAKARLKATKGIAGKLEFRCMDAMELSELPALSCDRVIALEAVNFFQDKERFLRGAGHALREGGCLCIVGHMPLRDVPYDVESVYSEFCAELGDDYSILANDASRSLLAIRSALEQEEKLKRQFKKFFVILERYLEMIKQCGFAAEEVRDATRQAIGFFPPLKIRMLELCKKYPSGHPNRETLKSMLLALFLGRYYVYRHVRAGYYLLRAKKC